MKTLPSSSGLFHPQSSSLWAETDTTLPGPSAGLHPCPPSLRRSRSRFQVSILISCLSSADRGAVLVLSSPLSSTFPSLSSFPYPSSSPSYAPSIYLHTPQSTFANTHPRMKCVIFTLLRSLSVSLPPGQEVIARTTIVTRPLVKGREGEGNMLPLFVERVD